jgi:hypothetical protein
MTAGRRRTPAAAVILAVLALALAGAGGALLLRRQAYQREGQRLVASAQAAVTQGLLALEDQLAGEARRARDVRMLRAALDRGVDPATASDLLATEDGWAPYRGRLALVLRAGAPWAKYGTGADELVDAALVAKAGQAAQAARATGWITRARGDVVAAAAVAVPDAAGRGAVLVLGQPIDASVLTPLSASGGAGLLASDGRSAGPFAGPPAWKAWLGTCVGREGAGACLDPEGRLVATAVPVTGGRWIWAAHALTVATPLPPSAALALFGAAACLAAAAFLARPRRAAGEQSAIRQVAQPLTGSDLRASTGGGAAGAPRRASAHQATQMAAGSTQSFGRYTLVDRLGEGGMSEIFTAMLSGAEGFHRLYVIKRLRPEFAQNKAAVDQFVDEAKLGSKLVHSNIVPVLDFGKVGTGYFQAQEYIAGRNLSELVERHQQRLAEPLPAAVVCYIAHEVLQALAYAHERVNDQGEPLHLVHRDVSTGNVMVTVEGEVKLLDFGIVRATERVSRTDLGMIKGNATFMAPEQARGRPVDGRADLFSLGMVMYYGLTGSPLYHGLSPAEVFYQATTGLTADHLAQIRALGGPLPALLERALAIDPNNRYFSARDFAEALAPYVGGVKADLATLMNALFGEDLRRQTASFRSKLGADLPDAQSV